ncbi:hypothetical protein Q1695_013315 [Nippostrongylus brasiliensis]|nr:hypothetical protein Q1695_013315 [Nippostrongylus brasiliensis]
MAALAQINLGQFSLLPTPGGGWDMGLSQGLNILGFGNHRALGISGNNGGVGLSGTDSAIVANERVGVDSGLQAGRGGVGIGSQLQFGNDPNPFHPGGQLGNFLDNIKNFFDSLVPRPLVRPVMPPPPRRAGPVGWQTGIPTTSRSRHVGTEGGVGPDGFLPRPWETDANVEPVDGDSRRTKPWDKEDGDDGPIDGSSRQTTPWDRDDTNNSPRDGDSRRSRPWTTEPTVPPSENSERHFATLVPNSGESISQSRATADPDPFEHQSDKPRQLPGMIGMSDPS